MGLPRLTPNTHYCSSLPSQAIWDGSIRLEHQDFLNLGRVSRSSPAFNSVEERRSCWPTLTRPSADFQLPPRCCNLFKSHEKRCKRYPYSTIHTSTPLQTTITKIPHTNNTWNTPKASALAPSINSLCSDEGEQYYWHTYSHHFV